MLAVPTFVEHQEYVCFTMFRIPAETTDHGELNDDSSRPRANI